MQNSKFKSFYFLITLFTFNFSLLTFAQSASAHVLKTDGSIGAVLHISPDDDPEAGENANFFFEIKDKNDKFDPSSCDCIGSILKENREIFSQPLFQNTPNPSLEDASFTYSFPEKNIYRVQISGKPMSGADFDSFTLTWDVRVDREAGMEEVQNNPEKTNWIVKHGIHLIFIVPATIFMIYVIIRGRKITKK